MKRLRRNFALPLLAKELVEAAARRRTYGMRVALALSLYFFFWLENRYYFKNASTALSLLGAGRSMFDSLVGMLFVGIYLAVPAMLCGVVTQEKERDSLVLLLLTRLRPWQIVLQKYAAAMVPALSALLLALPLGAVCYAYGGFTFGHLVMSVGVLVLAILQIGAIATWCSCRCRTTASAFLCTYIVGTVLVVVPGLAAFLVDVARVRLFSSTDWLGTHIPPVLLSFAEDQKKFRLAVFGGGETLLMTLGFLVLATRALPRYAFAPASNQLRRVFSTIDRWMHALNRFVGGVALGTKRRTLPENAPIYWREMRARALARPEYLARLLVFILVPVVGVILLLLPGSFRIHQAYELSAMGALVGGLGILLLATAGANCLVAERVSQTHDLLLTTPLSAAQIVREKARSLRPLACMVAIPLLVIFGSELALESMRVDFERGIVPRGSMAIYGTCVVSVLAIDLPLVAWLSMWCGMVCRTRMKAISMALAFIVGWCALPLVLTSAFQLDNSWSPARYLAVLSPLTVPSLNELDELDQLSHSEPWLPVALNALIYAFALAVIRSHCLRKADAYLRR